MWPLELLIFPTKKPSASKSTTPTMRLLWPGGVGVGLGLGVGEGVPVGEGVGEGVGVIAPLAETPPQPANPAINASRARQESVSFQEYMLSLPIHLAQIAPGNSACCDLGRCACGMRRCQEQFFRGRSGRLAGRALTGQHNIVNQPGAADVRRNRHQRAAGDVGNRIQRATIDDLKVIQFDRRLLRHHLLACHLEP
jgi:hypothetical protein